MSKLTGDHEAVRRLASLLTHKAEDVRNQFMRVMERSTRELTSGPDGWEGRAAGAYVSANEAVRQYLDRMANVFHQAASTLYILADRIHALQAMRDRARQWQEEAWEMQRHIHDKPGSHPQVPTHNIQALWNEINMCEQQYDGEAKREFKSLMDQLPKMGTLMGEVQHQLFVGDAIFTKSHVPLPVSLYGVAGRQGIDRVEFLNDSIRQNQLVYEYYKAHPQATGPNGESAKEMMHQAHVLQENARRQGGTEGVPIVFMHGLEGSEETFKTMVDYFGGATMVYTWNSSGEIDGKKGDNRSTSHPVVQYVFEKGAMKFEDQTEAFSKITTQLQGDFSTNYMIVVGHSMGGIVTTKYIEDTGGIGVTKFVTMGSPITGSKVDQTVHEKLLTTPPLYALVRGIEVFLPAVDELRAGSKPIQDMYDNRGQFNPNTEVLSVAGLKYGVKLGDSVVTEDSAFALKEFARAGNYTGVMHPEDDHSGLHEDPMAIQDVLNFILYGEKPHAKP
ncbi:alpha/beta hydrolase [Tumebacillus permanentifrigoris]|uniref:Putative alpha/beta hydrolase family protein n=1 Tax=Tumebacillus permanentifrigoris TaxID=378543 RepID=A0A316DDI5_9BACL|nr:alpha/beta hydrolase [Tumebacillus permanentifrigoris]PWK13518.1 putative alpha/beta hydrolase family protein [Tumebacillus permanentifrigoris]